MERSQINAEVERFLLLVSGSPPSDDDAIIEALSLALDQLAVAVHFIRYTFDSREHPEPPPRQYQQLRRMIERRFPQLGLYNIAAAVTTSVGESSCNVGDATDDLVDIALELAEFEWRRLHTSEDDAYWHLQNGYLRHWGDHLRSLQLYLGAAPLGRQSGHEAEGGPSSEPVNDNETAEG